jgi:hypothetical protein
MVLRLLGLRAGGRYDGPCGAVGYAAFPRTTIAEVEKSIALLVQSAAVSESEGANYDLIGVLTRQLKMAKRHRTQGDRCIQQQCDLVTRLERDGHNTHAARSLLWQLDEIHRLHITHVDLLEKKLALSKPDIGANSMSAENQHAN